MEKILGRDDILLAQDIVVEKVEVPEWGGTVMVRSLTAHERDLLDLVQTAAGTSEEEKFGNMRAQMAAASIVDEDGNKLFTSEDVRALGEKSAKALNRVFSKVLELSKIGSESVEDAEKN